MQSEDIEKIKERIAKLLRLAQDASSPNEAAIAAARVRSLMDKYQLTEADINGDVKESFGEEPALAKGRRTTYKNIPHYMNILSVRVAQFNDCQAVTVRTFDPTGKRKGTRKVIKIRGFKSDVELAASMFQSLIAMIDSACKAYMLSKGYAGIYNRQVGEAFKSACSSELCSRLHAITRARNEKALAEIESATPGTGLMIISKQRSVDAEFGEAKYTKTAYKGMSDNSTHEARQAGSNEGRKIRIQNHIGE